MPVFKIYTNVPKSAVPSTFLKETCSLLAKMFDKPDEQYCVVKVIPDQMMIFGGEETPCALASVMCIGGMGLEENKKYSKILGEHVEKHLGITPKRMYIEFHDVKSAELGFDRTTFHTLLG